MKVDDAYPDSPWSRAPETVTPSVDEVHVWRSSLRLDAERVEKLRRTLCEDERRRAERFRFPKDREAFTVGRGALRVILGRYLNAPPADLRFSYSPYGKPSLAPEHGKGELRFNLSHSGDLALYAVTKGREIGIDIEHMRDQLADLQIARRFFSTEEVAMLASLPEHAQRAAFFNCWTRKEAYIKARGEGLSLPLDKFAVSLAPGVPAALLSASGDSEEVSRWKLQELAPGPGYVAALAVEGKGWHARCWQWLGSEPF
ncbi:MAG: 4'-phosphopantetheinyl transferase superfamily protein [Pyrinomonadaceae bacterium]